MKIALCDDDPVFKKQLYAALQSYAVGHTGKPEFIFEFVYFDSAQALLASPPDYDLLFLDICLNDGYDGIEVGCSLRKMGCTAIFILTTSMDNRYKDGYRAGVLRYLTKPVQADSLKEALDSALLSLSTVSVKFSVHFEGTTQFINRKDIIFADNYLRKRTVHTATQIFQTGEAWEGIETQLDSPEFYELRRKYILNLNHVYAVNRSCITMSNREIIKFTRGDRENSGIDQFFAAFNSFLGRHDT